MVGEAMALWYPTGIRYGQHISYICPGGYATVGRDTNGSIGGRGLHFRVEMEGICFGYWVPCDSFEILFSISQNIRITPPGLM